jgi:acyl-CoA synthetase (NDP forming)
VGAAQVPALMAEVIERRSAESVILIPGGLGERSGSEGHVERLHAELADARRSEWGGPLLNGGNCLGIRSAPGRYDTLFIPRHKLRFPDAEPAPLAVVAQSGAFAVSRASKLDDLDPRYLVSIGNQLDLTVGDYLEHLADDPELRVIACYVEGFRPGDGRRWLRAVARFVDRGGTAVLYRAGRTAAGARASASHTASIAGDYAVTSELAAAAGVRLADSLADFEALVRLAVALDGKRPGAAGELRLGAVSNAGFECVAVADNLGPFRLAPFADATRGRLGELFRSRRVDAIVEVHNPLDLTPILDDEGFEEAARAVLDDPGVDLGVIGCVPLTGALQTLPAGAGHGEDLEAQGSVVERLLRLRHHPKPWVAVVDAGPLYDPMAHHLAAGGVPTFRTVDRALRLLAEWCRGRGA